MILTGWTFDGAAGMVLPKRPEKPDDAPIPALAQGPTLQPFLFVVVKALRE